jgi:hypothetical protein
MGCCSSNSAEDLQKYIDKVKVTRDDAKFRELSLKIYKLCNTNSDNIWPLTGIDTHNIFGKNLSENECIELFISEMKKKYPVSENQV